MVLNCDVVLTHPKIDCPVPLVEIITCSMTTGATPDFTTFQLQSQKAQVADILQQTVFAGHKALPSSSRAA